MVEKKELNSSRFLNCLKKSEEIGESIFVLDMVKYLIC
jgi:hypothetical protein